MNIIINLLVDGEYMGMSVCVCVCVYINRILRCDLCCHRYGHTAGDSHQSTGQS